MDIRCRRCGEPWDAWHLRNDVWYDARLPESWIENAEQVFRETGKISDDIREALAREGWEFGATTLNVKRCPCCRANGIEADSSPKEGVADDLENLLGSDLDALQAELEDLEDFGGND